MNIHKQHYSKFQAWKNAWLKAKMAYIPQDNHTYKIVSETTKIIGGA